MIKSTKKKRGRFQAKVESQMSPEEKQTLLQVAHKITELRRIQSVTQEDLAKRIGTTQSTISRIEAGRQNLTIDYIRKIASALNRNIRLKFVQEKK